MSGQWEYKEYVWVFRNQMLTTSEEALRRAKENEAVLNEHGANGWELVAVTYQDGQSLRYTFKRPTIKAMS